MQSSVVAPSEAADACRQRLERAEWSCDAVVIPGVPATKGRLLVATPALVDPNFDRTVIFVLEHHDDGALGVVLNRSTDERIAEPLDRWRDLLSGSSEVYEGGPVEPDALIALAEAASAIDPDDDQLSVVAGTITSVDLTDDPALVAPRVTAVRIFRGYAGWGPGQLEGEIATGAWLVLDAEPADVFGPAPSDLWRDVLRRQPGRLAWLALAPDDLSLN